MSNSLIKTDGFFYKIKKFFRDLFKNDKKQVLEDEIDVHKEIEDSNSSNLQNKNSYKQQLKTDVEKDELANDLLNNKKEVNDLDDKQTEEMIEYFEEDIKKQEEELLRIKNHIIEMQKELTKSSQ